VSSWCASSPSSWLGSWHCSSCRNNRAKSIRIPASTVTHDQICTLFGDDVTRCPGCDGHLRILAFVTDPDVTTAILDGCGSFASRSTGAISIT
jgi:hypothetical protein